MITNSRRLVPNRTLAGAPRDRRKFFVREDISYRSVTKGDEEEQETKGENGRRQCHCQSTNTLERETRSGEGSEETAGGGLCEWEIAEQGKGCQLPAKEEERAA